jgi:hypothetical protein
MLRKWYLTVFSLTTNRSASSRFWLRPYADQHGETSCRACAKTAGPSVLLLSACSQGQAAYPDG